MDTPIFDVLLADRLAGARAAVEQAGADATAFRAALDSGQQRAWEQLAEQQARTLTAERTRELTGQISVLEQRLRHAEEQAAAARAELEQSREPEVEPQVEATIEPEPAPPIVVADPPARPAIAATRTPGRKAADQGPTREDVPAVPSVKEILGSTRSASWLDTLLGSRR